MRYEELDGLRGIAAISVYFSHLIGVFDINSYVFDYLSNSPFHIFWHGESAVKLFFLLSGFVLTLPYIERLNLNLATFYIKRVFRIYPAFIVAIFFSIILQYFLFEPRNMAEFSNWINEFWKWNLKDISFSELINTFVLAGLPFDKNLFNPVIGTLRTEMIISFILPFFIFIAIRVKFLLNLLILSVLILFGKDTVGIFYLGIIMALFRNNILDFINKIDNLFYSTIFFVFASILYTSYFSLNFDNTSKSTLLLSVMGCAIFLVLAMKKGIFNTFFNYKSSTIFG